MSELIIPAQLDEMRSTELAERYRYNLDVVQLLDDQRFEVTQDVNCIGFVYFMEGVIPEEVSIDQREASKEHLLELFDETTEEDAEVVAVICTKKLSPRSPDPPYAAHMALIDPTDREFIIERIGTGHPIIRCRKSDMMIANEADYNVFLFLRKKALSE